MTDVRSRLANLTLHGSEDFEALAEEDLYTEACISPPHLPRVAIPKPKRRFVGASFMSSLFSFMGSSDSGKDSLNNSRNGLEQSRVR